VSVPVAGDRPGSQVLVDALRELDAEGVAVLDVAVRRPTLDDVFLTLTGRPAESADQPEPVEVAR
jgi:ABC-2 type transport system ATP-binding protein